MFKRLWRAWSELIEAIDELRDAVRETHARYRELWVAEAEESPASAAHNGAASKARKAAKS